MTLLFPTSTTPHPTGTVKATLIRFSTSLVHTSTEYPTSILKNLASLRKSSTTPLVYTTTDWELRPTSNVKASLGRSFTTCVYTTTEQHPTSPGKATLIRFSTSLVRTSTEYPTSTLKSRMHFKFLCRAVYVFTSILRYLFLDLASLRKSSTTSLIYTTTDWEMHSSSNVKATNLIRSFTTSVYTTTEQRPTSPGKVSLSRSSTLPVYTTTEQHPTSSVKANLSKFSTTPLVYTTTELRPTSTVKASLGRSFTTSVYTTTEQHPTSPGKATLIKCSTSSLYTTTEHYPTDFKNLSKSSANPLVYTTMEQHPTSIVKDLASLSKSSTTPVYTTTKLHPTNTVKATLFRCSTSPVYTTTELHSIANLGRSSTTPIYTTTELHSTSSVKVSLNRSIMTTSAYRTTGPSSTSIVNIQPPKDINEAVKRIQNLTKLLNNTEPCNKMPENCNRTFAFESAARVMNYVLNNSAFRPEPLLLPFSDFVTVFLHKGLYRHMEKTLSNLHYRIFVFNGTRDNPEASIKDTIEISLENITNHDNCKTNCIVKVFLGKMKRKELNITVGGKEYLLGSSIILVEMVVNGKHVTHLGTHLGTQHAIVNIPLVAEEINNGVKCMYLDAETKKWSSKGVIYVNTTKKIAKCETNHLSNFAVFFAAEELTSDGHRFALDLISYIGCGLTLLAVVVTLVIYLIFRKDAPVFSVDRNIVHVHLMVSLALVQILFLATLGVRTSPVGCKIVAVVLHYLLMASFCWMLLEGILVYLKIVMGFDGENVDLKKFYVFGWVFPAVIIAILVAVVIPLDRMDDVYGEGCFLSPKAHTIWVLLMPPVFCIALNLFVIVAVLRVLLTLSDDDTRKRKAKTAFRGLVILSPLLGFTWAFALAAHLHDAVFWQYAFCLSNSFQGFFIFLIHGVGNSEIQKVVKRKIYPLQSAASAPSRSNQGSSCEVFEEVATPSQDG